MRNLEYTGTKEIVEMTAVAKMTSFFFIRNSKRDKSFLRKSIHEASRHVLHAAFP